MKKVLKLQGLDCPVCAKELETEIAEIQGVKSASVSFAAQKLTLEYDSEDTLEKAVYAANHFEEVRVVEGGMFELNSENRKKKLVLILLSAAFFAVGFFVERLNGKTFEILSYVLFAAAYFSVGYPVLIATGKNIVKGRIFDENFLMTVASIGAIFLGEIHESVLVMLLYQLGEFLQGVAVGSSRRSVARLMDMKSEYATRITDNGEQERLAPEEIRVGDVLLVKVGEKIPVDGVLLDSETELDTRSLTGESELRIVKEGDELLSGCINAGKAVKIRTVRLYEDSAVGKILDLVENATEKKANPEKFITKFARVYTPVVCALALAIVCFAPLISYFAIGEAHVAKYATTALTFLVISCPCALVISVPLTYFSGIGSCAKKGILVKGATYLDVLVNARAMAFDKTGTLTEGEFSIGKIFPENGVEEAELLSVAASLERASAHPIAKAFSEVDCIAAEETEEFAGKGLKGRWNGENVLVGNAAFLKENGVQYLPPESDGTLVCVARNGKPLGAIAVGDRLRKGAKEALDELKKLGVKRLCMLTGDNRKRAEKIANEVGIDEVNAELLPNEKLEKAEELKKETLLAYVGDGVNDAPVMAAADCAVSMGKLGSAAAVESSDLVLISDDLSALPKAVKTARKTRSIVRQNICFSIVAKLAFMVLGVFGLPLWLAVFADVGVMLLAVLNSLRVRLN